MHRLRRASHNAECADGCTDLPLDLVDVDDLVAIATRAEVLEERVAELREVARALVEDDQGDWSAVHERARAAVLIAVPEAPEADVIQGWGRPGAGATTPPNSASGSASAGRGWWPTSPSTGSTPRMRSA